MGKLWFVVLVAATACGGSQKPSTPPPQLPPEQTAEPAKPADSAKPAEPAKPAPAPGPIEVTVPAPKVTVKLVSPGKGKREALKLSLKQGVKQKVELQLDFAGKQGTEEAIAPTIIFTGDAEVTQVADNGNAQFQMTMTDADVRSQPGQPVPADIADKLKGVLKELKLVGGVATNGASDDLKLKLDKADAAVQGVLENLKTEMLPAWPVLPAEPIGVGAKWQAVADARVADRLAVTVTTDYELVEHKGNTWTIKGAAKVTGADQDLGNDAKLSNINGSGTFEVAMIDGTLYPKAKHELSTGFSASGTGPDNKPVTVQFSLKQTTTITPK